MQRRQPAAVALTIGVWIGIKLDQDFDGFHMAVTSGPVNRSKSTIVTFIGVGASRDQAFDTGCVASPRRIEQVRIGL